MTVRLAPSSNLYNFIHRCRHSEPFSSFSGCLARFTMIISVHENIIKIIKISPFLLNNISVRRCAPHCVLLGYKFNLFFLKRHRRKVSYSLSDYLFCFLMLSELKISIKILPLLMFFELQLQYKIIFLFLLLVFKGYVVLHFGKFDCLPCQFGL